MRINKNGIELDITNADGGSVIRIVRQSPAVTRILSEYKNITDPDTGFSIRSNSHPSFNKSRLRLYLRGSDRDKNDQEVFIASNIISHNRLVQTLDRLLGMAVERETVSAREANSFIEQNKSGHIGVNGKPINKRMANTTLVRMAFINREMAKILQLTDCNKYPDKCIEWEALAPVHTKNAHYNEHLGQIVDVLNKSVGNSKFITDVVNPHNVTADAAKWMVKHLRSSFEEAHKMGRYHLIAMWRTYTGLRGPDFTD